MVVSAEDCATDAARPVQGGWDSWSAVQCDRGGTKYVDIRLNFRYVAAAYLITFFFTLTVAGVVTFTATAYDPETDKIQLFYGMFNPCIWFDHYPAKALAMTGIGFMILIGIAYAWMIFIWTWTDKALFKTMWAGAVLQFCMLLDLTFVNVFTTNLYPGPLDEGRRLHGVHHEADGSFALSARHHQRRDDILTPEVVKTIGLHTSFYIGYLVAEIAFSLFLLQFLWDSSRKWSRVHRYLIGLAWTVGLYGMVLHASAMLVIVLQNEPMFDWYFKKRLQGSVQHLVIWVDAKTYTSTWGWLPVMLFRFALPSGTGINIRFSLSKTVGDDGAVLPEYWVGRCVRAVAGIMAAGGVFHQAWEEQDSNSFKLADAMRSKPFAYMAAPAYLGATVLMVVGLVLTVVQRQLMSGRISVHLLLTAIGFFFSMYGCMLTILDRFVFSSVFFGAVHVAYVLWVLQLSVHSCHTALPYLAAGWGIISFAHQDGKWYWYYFYLSWLMFYNQVVPDGPTVHISATRLGHIDDSYSATPEECYVDEPGEPCLMTSRLGGCQAVEAKCAA